MNFTKSSRHSGPTKPLSRSISTVISSTTVAAITATCLSQLVYQVYINTSATFQLLSSFLLGSNHQVVTASVTQQPYPLVQVQHSATQFTFSVTAFNLKPLCSSLSGTYLLFEPGNQLLLRSLPIVSYSTSYQSIEGQLRGVSPLGRHSKIQLTLLVLQLTIKFALGPCVTSNDKQYSGLCPVLTFIPIVLVFFFCSPVSWPFLLTAAIFHHLWLEHNKHKAMEENNSGGKPLLLHVLDQDSTKPDSQSIPKLTTKEVCYFSLPSNLFSESYSDAVKKGLNNSSGTVVREPNSGDPTTPTTTPTNEEENPQDSREEATNSSSNPSQGLPVLLHLEAPTSGVFFNNVQISDFKPLICIQDWKHVKRVVLAIIDGTGSKALIQVNNSTIKSAHLNQLKVDPDYEKRNREFYSILCWITSYTDLFYNVVTRYSATQDGAQAWTALHELCEAHTYWKFLVDQGKVHGRHTWARARAYIKSTLPPDNHPLYGGLWDAPELKKEVARLRKLRNGACAKHHFRHDRFSPFAAPLPHLPTLNEYGNQPSMKESPLGLHFN